MFVSILKLYFCIFRFIEIEIILSNRTLTPNDIQCVCTYKNKTNDNESSSSNNYKQPVWREEFNLGKKYQPSFNIAPTDVTPVLISKAHFSENESETKDSATSVDVDPDHPDNKSNSADCDRMLIPMMWGMIPFWHKVNKLCLFFFSYFQKLKNNLTNFEIFSLRVIIANMVYQQIIVD